MFLFNSAYSQTTGESSVYFMYSPLQSNTTYLVDTAGVVYHTWDCSANPASTAYLPADDVEYIKVSEGEKIAVLRVGGSDGKVSVTELTE